MPNEIRQRHGRIFEQRRNAAHGPPRADADRQTVFTEQTAHRIYAGRAVGLPVTSHAMERLERLLLKGLDGYRSDVATANRLQ